jgi:hypothetical protein
MTASVLLALAFASILNRYEIKRAFACVTVLLVTVASYCVYESDWYFPLEETLGYYGYQSLAPLLSVLILAKIKCRLSSCLMVLFCILVSGNLVFWYVEGLGNDVEAIYQQAVLAMFCIELALMFSKRLTNVVHGVVHRPKLDRDNSPPIYAFEHLDYRPTDNANKDFK